MLRSIKPFIGTRPLCKQCKIKVRAMGYRRGRKVYWRSLCDTCIRKKKKLRTVNIPDDSWNLFQLEETHTEDHSSSINKMKVCLQKLKPHEVELIEMRFFEERPFKEVGEILGLTTENARVKTHRAIKKLQKLFKA